MEINLLEDFYQIYSIENDIKFNFFKGLYETDEFKNFTYYEDKISSCNTKNSALLIELQNKNEEMRNISEKYMKEELELKEAIKNEMLVRDKYLKLVEEQKNKLADYKFGLLKLFKENKELKKNCNPEPTAPPQYDEIKF